MARQKLANRNPDWKDSKGNLVYSKRDRVKIWNERLRVEFFPPPRKPSHSQRLQIASAVCLILELSAAHESFTSGKPLPKNYLPTLNALRAILAGFRVKAPRKATQQADPDKGMGLAAILSGGEA